MRTSFSRDTDTTISAYTAEGIAFELYPAGVFIRACAFAIDTLIQWSIILSAVIILGVLNYETGNWALLLIIFAVDWFYHFFWEIGNAGQSPGKKLLGLRVIQNDGTPEKPSSSFLRNLLRFADTYLFLYLISFLCISFSNGFRRIGDWAAGTLVVWTTTARPFERTFTDQSFYANIKPAASEKKLTFEERSAFLMFARRYPMLGKARADEIAKFWTDAHNINLQELNLSPAEYVLGIAKVFHGA